MATPRPKLKSNLVISRQSDKGTDYFIFKDPDSGRFFKLKEKEHFVAGLFDSTRTFEDIAVVCTEKFGSPVLTEDISKFYDRLSSLGLFENEDDRPGQVDPGLWQQRPLLQKILFIKIKAFNPDSFLERSLPYIKWLFSPFMIPVYLGLIFWALVIFFSNRLELSQQMNTLGPGSIPLIYITVIFVTIFHEMAHGYACKLYGGKVSEMGFLFLYSLLSFYTNVSDAYLFPDKKKRMAVTSAGIKLQILMWAIAMIIWSIMAPETIFNHVALIIVMLSFLIIIFNLNPLLKLDAYYYLVDYLGIPNLRSRAFTYWKQRFFRILSPGYPQTEYPAREITIYNWYGLAAILYSTGFFGYVLINASRFIFTHIGVLGVALLYGVIIYSVLEALKKAGFWDVIMSEKGNILRPRNWIIILVVVAGLALVSLVVRINLKISQDCLIYPIESLTVTSSDPTSVELMLDRGSGEKSVQRLNLSGLDLDVLSIDPLVGEGDAVDSGQLIARITSTESQSQLAESRANIDRARSQLELLKNGPRPEEIAQTQDLIEQVGMKLTKSNSDLTRSQELSSKGMIPTEQLESDRMSNEILKSEISFYQKQKLLQEKGARPEEIAIAEADINAIQAKINRLEQQLAANDIYAPFKGTVTALRVDSNIITLARTDTMRIRIPVPEKEISPVKVGQEVKLKVMGYPGETLTGVVTKISGQTEKGALQPVFVVTAKAPNTLGLMKPGMTGRAKIYCGKWPIYRVLLWRVVRWFRVEAWSWF
jgi:putative peptide zinc metalloprotease protein